VQLPFLNRAEERIAGAVQRVARAPSGLPAIKGEAAVEWAGKRAGFAFADGQRGAILAALRAKLSVLTGGPGTGKTASLRALVEILRAKRARVNLAAPTGRAAQRLAESTGGSASTIHRLLGFDAARGGFAANADSPLETDFLIVDEASMLDTRLAAALFEAIPSRAHVLLVGDTDQLPSVGAGNVLKDIIATASPPGAPGRVPVTRLGVIHRQQGESLIVRTAHAIHVGDASLPPVARELSGIADWGDLAFVAADSAEDCLKKTVALCAEFIPRALPGIDRIRDVQVLAPMHRGIAGVANLNAQLQAALNPHGAGAGGAGPPGGGFRAGDKVIQLRNNYDKNIFNGDIGMVAGVDTGSGELTVDFDGERHAITRGETGDLGLAYAISIHKSQGSEYPVVVVPLLKGHFMMLQRNLLYTAITRGRKRVFIVGEPAAYGMAVRNAESRERCTHLREKILSLAAR
jgi:exodeoxyribonuclease V alpha subunit